MQKEPLSFSGRLDISPPGAAVAILTWTLPAVAPYFMGLQVFAPLPVFYHLAASTRSRGINTLAAALLASCVIMVMVGQLGGMIFTLLMLPVGAALAREGAKDKTGPVGAGFRAALLLLLSWLAWSLFYGMAQTGSAGLYSDILVGLDSGLVEVGRSLAENSDLTPEQALEVEETVSRLRSFLPRLLPGLLIVTVLNTVFLNMVTGQWLLRRKSAELAPWPPLAEWRLPEALVILVILAGIVLLLPMPAGKTLGFNLLLITGSIYFFQGLAVLTSLLARWAVHPSLKVLVYVLVLLQAYGIALLAIAGLVDVWADLRRRRPARKETEER